MSDQGRDAEYTLADVTRVFESREDYAEPLTASAVRREQPSSAATSLAVSGSA